MNKLLLSALIGCVVLFTACKENSPTAPAAPMYVGTWKGSYTTFGITVDAVLKISDNNTFSEAFSALTVPMADANGTWSIANNKLILKSTSCREANDAGVMVTTTCDSPDTLSAPTTTTWDIPDGIGGTLRLLKQ